MKVKKGKMVSVIDRTVSNLDKVKVVDEIKAADGLKKVEEFKTLAEQVAKSTVFFKNFYIEELREIYKFNDRMKRIDKVFPYAKITEKDPAVKLYVDEPNTEMDHDICINKAKIMKKMGLKYLIIEKDATLFDALEQLGVI